MPNQLNYPTKLNNTEYQRPSRLTNNDDKLVLSGSQEILFGTRKTDNVEIWVYNPNGSFAGHIRVPYNSDDLGLSTIIDTSGANEVLNLDVKSLALDMGLSPGRYVFVFNFFRDEVGSETGYKLYISEISSDRTEVKLQLVGNDDSAIKDIREFILPSVPRQDAQLLIDQSFGKSLDAKPGEYVTSEKVVDSADASISDTKERIRYSNTDTSFHALVTELITDVHTLTLNNMANDPSNYSIQSSELFKYIENALDHVIYTMKQSGKIDPRFNIIG